MSARRRLDREMVRRGLVDSQDLAQDLILSGRVTVDGAPADKATRQVSAAQAVVVSEPAQRFVGRGGEKLDAALSRFPVEVVGRRAVDVGSSTGGFTDCLLQRGAVSVVAIDVGRGQLHQRLRGDDRVTVHERTDVRAVVPAEVGAPFDLLVADVSFIPLGAVLPSLVSLVGEGSPMVLLVKPQFEASREEADRGRGVIRDPEVWLNVLAGVQRSVCDAGAAIMDGMVSPITGAEGNVEFLVHATVGVVSTSFDLAALVASAGSGDGGHA
jgi:23S rRNA (cytidine1920-2'-O)/16S rRNA (cytidine1409-2'-O)-methyltransferase